MTDSVRVRGCRRVVSRLALLAGCLAVHLAASAQPISAAEELLFTTNHMQAVEKPVTLVYSFQRKGGTEPDFSDEVRLDVTQVNPDKSVAVALHFLTGDRAVDLPEIGSATGNPVILGFLERDITEMKRLTGGATNYFRKRIRLALAAMDKLHPVQIRYGGKLRDAQEVHIQPYRDDPLRDRFKELVNKRYVFVVSKDVPGGLFQISTSWGDGPFMDMPKSGRQDGVTETLTLVKDDPYTPAGGKPK